ncbi:MAG: Asp-tRNA(Asn)/Glu-tRNA(Gln) amidotransferase subunit GatC [Deltaproteobacteria bacterium]|nr:Asp-tRNA(Asn)/Glu-tRNA(Gln) amidotransferase subunit GatC [Deltaproteobacteria bacterium]
MISRNEVKKVAILSRISLKEDETDRFTEQLGTILDYMNKLNELDVEDIDPAFHIVEFNNVFRDDKVKASLVLDEALKNAPKKEGAFFKVPRIIK